MGKPGGCKSAVGLLPSDVWGFLVIAARTFKPTADSSPVSWLTSGLVPFLLFTSRPRKGCGEVKRPVFQKLLTADTEADSALPINSIK